MTRPALLNNTAHAKLRVHRGHGRAYGDNLMSALAVVDEFRSLQACYPIVFQKSADQTQGTQFQPIVLLGLEEGQNLFLNDTGWDAHYVPLSIERGPFMIGSDGDQLLVHVDMDSPRIAAEAQGEAVFMPHGGPSEFLEHINSVLMALHDGAQRNTEFVAALLKLELLESFVLDVEDDDGSQGRLSGLYIVNEEKLDTLSGAQLEQLQRDGHLLAIYMTLASVARFRDLIERKRKRARA